MASKPCILGVPIEGRDGYSYRGPAFLGLHGGVRYICLHKPCLHGSSGG